MCDTLEFRVYMFDSGTSTLLTAHPHLLVRATNEQWTIPTSRDHFQTFRASLASENHWLQPMLVLSVPWWDGWAIREERRKDIACTWTPHRVQHKLSYQPLFHPIPPLSRAESEKKSWAARPKSVALPVLAAKRWIPPLLSSLPFASLSLALGGSCGLRLLARHRPRRAGLEVGLPLTQARSGPAKASHVAPHLVAILQTPSKLLAHEVDGRQAYAL